MNHIDEDILLKYALELIENKNESIDIESHLASCPDCRTLLENIRADIDLIGSVEPRPTKLDYPVQKPKQNTLYPILRAAAFIIFGMVIGYGAASIKTVEKVSVSPSYAVLTPAHDSLVGVAVSDATEVTLK